MESVKVCRFCLAMGLKMHLIQEKDLKALGSTVPVLQNLPPYGCYECSALIDKFIKFIDRCAITQAVLCSILEDNDEITKNNIRSIDRRAINLESSLKFSRTSYINCGIPSNINQKQQYESNQDDTQSGLWPRDKITVISVKSKDMLEDKTTCTQKRDILRNLLISMDLNDVEMNEEGCSEEDRQNKKRPEEADPILKVEIQELNIENVRIKEETDCVLETKVEDDCEVDSVKWDESSSLSGESDIDEGEDISLKKFDIDDLSDLLATSSDDDLMLNVKKKVQNKKPPQKKKINDNKTQKQKNTDDMELIMRLIQPKRKKNKKKKKCEPKLDEMQSVLLDNFVITHFSEEEQVSEFAKRKQSSNYMNSTYRCELCYRGFKTKETYDNHAIDHVASPGQTVCKICKIVIKYRFKVSRHMTRHRMKFTCKTCGFTTDNRNAALLHKKWHDGVTYECRLCGEVSHRKSSYLSHMRIKHPSEFICNLCGHSFLSAKGVQMHKDKSHKTDKQNELENKDGPSSETGRYCEECDVRFATRDAWRRHLSTSAKHNNTTSPGLRCRECGDEFENVDALKLHRAQNVACAVQHRAQRLTQPRAAPSALSGHYPAKCEHCDMVMTSRSRHWHHYQSCHRDQRYPHTARNYICEACGKGFTAKSTLDKHVLAKHTETKSVYECDHCHKQFDTKSRLYIHIQRHMNATHLCTLCGKSLKSKSSLVEHYRRQHGGPRPFPCQYCGKTFTRGSVRTLHVNEVHLGLAKKRIRKPKRRREPDH